MAANRSGREFPGEARRSAGSGDDDPFVSPSPATDHGAVLLALYPDALPEVYGYLRARCGSTNTAEELTSETFLSAVHSAKTGTVSEVTVAWLIGIARHKLMDQWRRSAREARNLKAVEDMTVPFDDPWDATIDAHVAHAVLGAMGVHHRSALTLRYLDGLSVPQVASALGRTVHATEALLVRARNAFRLAYGDPHGDNKRERTDDGR